MNVTLYQLQLPACYFYYISYLIDCRLLHHNYWYISNVMKSQVRCMYVHKLDLIGYEPADLTVHPPPRTAEGGFIFFV